MKTTYKAKTLCVAALLGAAATLSAQENNTEKDKNLSREMTLEREYDPTVQDANKVNTLPAVKVPAVRKASIDYATFTVPADPEKEIGLLPSGRVMTEMNYNQRRGYFNFGAGTYLNLNGDLGYHILSTQKDELNIFLSHRSTNGKVKYLELDEKVKAKLNDNLAGIHFQHEFEKAALTLGARYGYTAFNYYGRPMLSPVSSRPPDTADRTSNQVNQTLQVNAAIESKEEASFGYLLDLGYTNFSYKYGLGILADGPTEQTFDVKFDLNAAFGGNQKIGLGGNVVYLGYNNPAETERPGGGYYVTRFENHAEATLSPYYKLDGEGWNVKLGANVMFITGEESKVMASPNISADVQVADKTVLYALASGKLSSNTLYEVSRINRYIDPTFEITPSRNWLDATLGIKSGVATGFWFDLFAGYKITSDNYFFLPARSYMDNEFGCMSEIFAGIDTKQLLVGASLKYSYQQLFDLSLKGVYNNWNAKQGSGWIPGNTKVKAYGMPEMEMTASVTLRPVKNLTATLDYYLATGRETCLWGADDIKMKNINELNLTGTYTFNDTFGIYVKLNNLLFQRYELLYGYPLQSFSAMAGFNINF